MSTADIRATTSGQHEFDTAERLASGSRFLIIVECNESDFDSHARHIVGLWFTLLMACAVQAAEASGGRLKRPVSFFLDEFGVMPPIPGFHKTANLGRSRGLSFFVFLQSVEQLAVNYGSTAGAVLASLCTKVFFCSGLAVVDREYASRLAGSVHVIDWRETQTQSLSAVLHYLDYMRVRDAEEAVARSSSEPDVVFKGRTTVVRRVQRPHDPPPPRPGCSPKGRHDADPRKLCGQGASDMMLWE